MNKSQNIIKSSILDAIGEMCKKYKKIILCKNKDSCFINDKPVDIDVYDAIYNRLIIMSEINVKIIKNQK